MSVNQQLTPDGPVPEQRRVENHDYAMMLKRMVRAYVLRVGAGDPEDLTEALDLAVVLDNGIRAMIGHLREEQGFSWADIGRAAHMTRQGAFKRWGP